MSTIPEKPLVDRVINTTMDVKITVFELYDMVYVKKMSDSVIARTYGISTRTIRNYRKKCQFDATFKSGTMDLPLSEVREMVSACATYHEIAVAFNTTKTAVKSFCDRHGIRVDDTWPIDRVIMVDYILKEFTNTEIASKHGVTDKDVELLQAEFGLVGFEGNKTHERLGTTARVEMGPFDGMSVGERFLFYFPEVAGYNKVFGYTLSGSRVSLDVVMAIVSNFESSEEYLELVSEHSK